MKIYIDVILFINFAFNFILLLSVSLVLKRNVKIFKIVLGALLGSISVFTLFMNINSLELFIFKIITSIFMVVISFNYKNIKYTIKNLTFLYISSTILGGALYILNNQFAYKQEGLVFYHNGLSINFIVLLLSSPLIIYLYVKQLKELKINYSNYYNVKLHMKDNIVLNLNGYLDTGNKLKEPITNLPVILINKKDFIYDINEFKMFLVPYKTITTDGVIKCIKAEKIIINGVGEKYNFLVGLVENEIKMDGINCILNNRLLEE